MFKHTMYARTYTLARTRTHMFKSTLLQTVNGTIYIYSLRHKADTAKSKLRKRHLWETTLNRTSEQKMAIFLLWMRSKFHFNLMETAHVTPLNLLSNS